MSYTASGAIPSFLPAKFSIQLGAGLNSSAPYPYVATTQPIQQLDLLDPHDMDMICGVLHILFHVISV